jgi:hypothetical protein
MSLPNDVRVFHHDKLLRRTASIGVNNAGIWDLSPSGAPIFFPWGEVVAVTARNPEERFLVADSAGREIQVAYDLENFGSLASYILDHTVRQRAHASEEPPVEPTSEEPRRRSPLFAIAFSFCALCTIAASVFGFVGYAIPFLALMIYAVIARLFQPRSIHFTQDSIQICSSMSMKTIPYREISRVSLDITYEGEVGPLAVVTLQLTTGDSMNLRSSLGDPVMLYDRVKNALKRMTSTLVNRMPK